MTDTMKNWIICMQVISIVALSAVSLSSCAELRKGWVKVDFVEGHPSEMVVCQIDIKKDDMEGKCVSLDTVERQMRARHVRRMPSTPNSPVEEEEEAE